MVPFSYISRNLVVRWKTTMMAASGFTLVVAALVVMLACVKGVQRVCAISGEAENVIVLGKGNVDEVLSRLNSRQASELETIPGVALDSSGSPLASRELYMVIQPYNEKLKDYVFQQVRGVYPMAFQVHTNVKVVEGQLFRRGQSDVIIGKGFQREYELKIGDSVDIGNRPWKVCGVFEAEGTAFENEMWCDLMQLASQFRREGSFCTCVLRAKDAKAAAGIVEHIKSTRSLDVTPNLEVEYYAKQGENARIIEGAAWVIALFMGIGAVFGIMNTMYASISMRTKDIAVLRLLGFQPREILISFLAEAMIIAVIGGCLGTALGYMTNGVSRNVLLGLKQVEFAFQVDLGVVMTAGAFIVVMGCLGGLLPAMAAMRIKPIEALR
jgi:putative ABC transport system permease protein